MKTSQRGLLVVCVKPMAYGCIDCIDLTQLNLMAGQGAGGFCSVNKLPGQIRARPDIRAFGENCLDNGRIFVILPGYLRSSAHSERH